ncbi:MAG: ParB family transcriptional regulator, chromosome partitioning protein [Gaiellales bacterium]|nr:ParB family transcriptional regulator, chromosome partitioning protein [Gaiellales bacterium]
MDSAPPRRGLGQGLALLLGEPQGRTHGALREIPIQQITPNPRQPRARIDEERFAELVESVRRDGIVQPLLVREVGDGWELIAGERRWRAAQAAGLSTVPALVREADDRTSLALALVENIVRADLDPIEQARGYARLQDEFGLSHADVALAVGRSRTTIVNATRLLGLPDDVLELIEGGELTEGHGRALLQIEGQEERREASRAVVAGKLSVRQTEALARTQGRSPPRRSATAPDWYDAELANDAVDGLYRTLGIAARVAPDRSGCRVELRLRSAEQLAGLVARLAALEGGG